MLVSRSAYHHELHLLAHCDVGKKLALSTAIKSG
jgi:hypothetical protein